MTGKKVYAFYEVGDCNLRLMDEDEWRNFINNVKQELKYSDQRYNFNLHEWEDDDILEEWFGDEYLLEVKIV